MSGSVLFVVNVLPDGSAQYLEEEGNDACEGPLALYKSALGLMPAILQKFSKLLNLQSPF